MTSDMRSVPDPQIIVRRFSADVLVKCCCLYDNARECLRSRITFDRQHHVRNSIDRIIIRPTCLLIDRRVSIGCRCISIECLSLGPVNFLPVCQNYDHQVQRVSVGIANTHIISQTANQGTPNVAWLFSCRCSWSIYFLDARNAYIEPNIIVF